MNRENSLEYTLVRSRRRTLAVEITRQCTVVVRAPLRCPRREIERFVAGHEQWILEHLEKQRLRAQRRPEPDAELAAELKKRAQEVLLQRTAHFSALMGLTPTSVRITGARTRFGSCSAKNRICFSWRLMQYPREAIDYVVVHELAHIRHHAHSPAFYALIAQYLPDWKARMKLLKE